MILKKMRSCLWKLVPVFQTYGLIHLLGPSFPKLVFRPQTTDVTALGSKSFFMSSCIIFCMKQAFIFKFWIIFDKVLRVYSQKIAKILSKILFWVPFQIVLFKFWGSSIYDVHKKWPIFSPPTPTICKINNRSIV